MSTQTNNQEQDKLAKLLTIGLISGIIAAGVNICYMLLYESTTGFSMEKYINVLNVSIASIIPGIFAGLFYFSLRRVKPKSALNIYIALVTTFALLSFMGPLSNQLPDGSAMPPEFAGLTIPMHIFAPIIYLAMTIRSVPRAQ
jgi:cytochrome bd-type quinol oxidase subunit 2